MRYSVNVLSLLVIFCFCTLSSTSQKKVTANDYVMALKKVTDVMLNDVASPVAASRYYAYTTLASYETLSCYDHSLFPSMEGTLNGFPPIKINTDLLNGTDRDLAMILAIFKAGKKLLPSGFMMDAHVDSLRNLYGKSDATKLVFSNTATLVDEIVNQVIVYARADGFVQLNNLARYTPKPGDGYWKPTAPVFISAIEPQWKTLRTFFIDSVKSFTPERPAEYDTAKSSKFYQLMLDVYTAQNTATDEQKEIASFWDCNPFAVQQIGHVEFGLKKISPGGHWIGITGIACIKSKYSLYKTAVVHLLVGATLADAFIVCWDEKYRSNRVRPETVIQKILDPRWRPLLQTPPFPEYVSGHSVASNAASVILTSVFGTGFTYKDNTELEFGLPVRKFSSFEQAAAEASISRFYGGIHFRDAIEVGRWQGIKVANLAVQEFEKFFQLLNQ